VALSGVTITLAICDLERIAAATPRCLIGPLGAYPAPLRTGSETSCILAKFAIFVALCAEMPPS
jgi:hypothetical protein